MYYQSHHTRETINTLAVPFLNLFKTLFRATPLIAFTLGKDPHLELVLKLDDRLWRYWDVADVDFAVVLDTEQRAFFLGPGKIDFGTRVQRHLAIRVLAMIRIVLEMEDLRFNLVWLMRI